MLPPASSTPLLTRLRHGWRLLLTLGSLFGGAALVVGLVVFTAYRHGVFERQLLIRVRVPDAHGLRPGSRVILSGVPVGALRQLEVQGDGQVLLQLRVPFRYRGVVSPASSVSIAQDYLMGDQQLNLKPAPAPAASVPDRFEVPYRGGDSLEDLLAGVQSTLVRLDRLLQTGERLGQGELPRTLQQLDRLMRSGERLGQSELPRTLTQLRGTLQRADALSGTLQRELPPTAAVLRQTGREAGSTAREARLALSELVLTLVQIRPQLSRALLQVDGTGEQARMALIWLNQLIDKLDPEHHLRRLGPKPPIGVAPSQATGQSGPSASGAAAVPARP
jgi:phospholipid/cholesterol/gamma-HCH transport system substrate-binding protein